MSKPVTHQFVMRPGPWGGTVTTTLCGRQAAERRLDDPNDGQNAGDGAEVTCKFCLKMRAARK